MKYNPVFFLLLVLATTLISCKKSSNSNTECLPGAATSRQITGKPATVAKLESEYYLVEQGSIDTKLKPCNLATEFQVDNLAVTITGDVKGTVPGETYCCTDIFVIMKISR